MEANINNFFGRFESDFKVTEAFMWSCSIKKVLLKNSQKNAKTLFVLKTFKFLSWLFVHV